MYFIVGFLLFLTGCQPATQTLTIAADYQDKPVTCGNSLMAEGNAWQVDTLRFYVSDLALKQAGKWHHIPFLNNDWQHENVALVSLTTPDCQMQQINAQLSFDSALDWQDVEAVRFSIGVPFERNHLNPLTQPSPLNLPAMFWSWQLGHKFIRLDMQQPQGRDWSFHLGSIGCQSASRMRSPQQPCQQPHLYTVELAKPASDKLVLQLDQLLADLSLGSARTCMFRAPDISSCLQVVDNLHNRQVFSWQ